MLKSKLPKGWASKEYHGHNVFIPGTTSYLRSRTFQTWFNMISRCYYTSNRNYQAYGGRGITVCKRWRDSFLNFLEDVGHRPKNKTLDRKNVNGNYSKRNCRWATAKEQARNKRSLAGAPLPTRKLAQRLKS